MAAPWETQTPAATQPNRTVAPWEQQSPGVNSVAQPAPKAAPQAPWEAAELEQARLEEGTLFGRGKAQTALGELGAGLQSGVRGLIATPPALGSLAMQQLESLTGYGGETAQNWMQTAQRISSGGAQRGIGSIEEAWGTDPGNWVRYVAGVTGEAVPFIVSIMAGGGGARILASQLVARGVPASTRAGILASIPAEFAGAAGTAVAIETGATAQELHEATGQIRPGASLLAGSAKGALESIFPAMLAKGLGLTGGQAADLFQRLMTREGAKQLGRGALVEAGTEFLQEEVDLTTRSFLDQNYGYLSPEANSRRINALAAGFTAGGVIQAGAQAMVGQDPASPMPGGKELRRAMEDMPYVTGQANDELPVSDPDDILRTSAVGGPTTVTAANTYARDQLLAEDPIMGRGLYAPVVQGMEPSFGSQDEAIADGRIMGGVGYLRLDPQQVTRGDLTAAVQDLPWHTNDPRLEFTKQETANEAHTAMVEAIKLKVKATKARSGIIREQLLQEAQGHYRQAVNLGARVEPMPDGQVMLRDTNKLGNVASRMERLASQQSQAGLQEARTLPGGKKFYVFEKGAEPAQKGMKGRQLDLEKMSPDAITALPSSDMMRRLSATYEVTRNLSIGRARGMGIRFIGKLTEARQKALLRRFVRLSQAMPHNVPFNKMPASYAEKFMKLVDAGLRLDVNPDMNQFAVLDQQGIGVFTPEEQQVSSEVVYTEGMARIVKQRARRGRDPRVSDKLQFHDEDTRLLFFSQFHNNPAQAMIAGPVSKGIIDMRATGPVEGYVAGKSPLAAMLRGVVKGLHIKTDYVIEIVPPSEMPDRGVRYVEKTIELPSGKRSEARSVIQINPWYYGEATKGGKPLTKIPSTWAMRGGAIYMSFDAKPTMKDQSRLVSYGGQIMKLGNAIAQDQTPKTGAGKYYVAYTSMTEPGLYIGFRNTEKFMDTFRQDLSDGNLVPIDDPLAQDVHDWQTRPPTEKVPPPKYTPITSEAGIAAQKLGTPQSKMFVTGEMQTELYADVAVALSETIVKYEWARTECCDQEMIQDAWRREQHLSKGTLRETQLSKVMPHPLLGRALSADRGRKTNQFAFEEWLVLNIARTMTRGDKVWAGPVERFMKKSADLVRRGISKLWTAATNSVKPYSLDPRQGKPHEIVERWLLDLQLRTQDGTAQPFLEQGTRDALITSINKNRRRFQKIGLDEYVVASPERASSRQIRELIKIMPKDKVEETNRLRGLIAAADRHSTAMDWLLGIHQMQDLNPHIEGLRDYTSLTRAMENASLSWSSLADGRIREAQKLGKEQLNNMWAMMFDLDQMVYIPAAKLKDGTEKPRWPTQDELKALVQKHKITRDAFQVYVNIRNDFIQFIAYLNDVSVKHAQETISDPEALAARIAEIQGETAQIRERPYFPHMRFGRFALVVKQGDKTVHFETFETRKQRDAGAKLLEKQFLVPQDPAGETRIIENEMSDVVQQYQGLPGYALRNVMKALGLTEDPVLLTQQQKQDKAMLEAMVAMAAPTESVRKSLMGRKNVPGWSTDGLRAYANYFGRSARFLARMEFGARLEQSIQNVRASGSELTRDKRTRIADQMQKHFDTQMQPAADWATLRGIGFLWYFAFVPAAAVTNLTQVPMVSMPFLASKFGDMKTMGRVTQAYGKAMKDTFSWLRGTAPVEDNMMQEAIEEAHFNRLLDDGFATELAAISQGPVLQATIPGSAFARGVRRFAQWGTLPFQLAERVNRTVTFRATYQLALNNPDVPWIEEVMVANKPEADQLRIDRGWPERNLRAYMAATDAVRKSQFEYGRWARPKLMEGPRGVLLMFKTYLQNMLYFMFKSERKVQVRFMLLMLFAAGVMGLPGAEDLAELAKFLARQMGIVFDFERTLRELMVDYGAADAVSPDLLLHGASRYGFGVNAAANGLGLPLPRVDLSGSLSMGRIIPGLKAGLNPGSGFANDAVGEVVSEIAGPVFGVPFNMYQSLIDHNLPAEDPKRWERALPRALKAASVASRHLAEQRERDRTGATVMSWDPNDLNDQADILLGLGLGFQPTKLKQTWDYVRAQKEVQDYWKGQRAILMSELYRAHRLRDKEGKGDALEAIRRFNEEAPDKALKITSESLRNSLQTRTRARRMKEQNIPREKFLRGVSQGVDRLYPEVIHRRVLPRGRVEVVE